jgi:hypothetical protein
MKHAVMIAMLCMTVGLAHADTFELSDPANEVMKEVQDPEAQVWTLGESAAGIAPLKNALCTVDTETGDCSCIDQKHAKKLSLTREECVSEVLRALRVQ